MVRLRPVPALLTTRGDPLCLLIHGLDLGGEIPRSGAASPDSQWARDQEGGLGDRMEAWLYRRFC